MREKVRSPRNGNQQRERESQRETDGWLVGGGGELCLRPIATNYRVFYTVTFLFYYSECK